MLTLILCGFVEFSSGKPSIEVIESDVLVSGSGLELQNWLALHSRVQDYKSVSIGTVEKRSERLNSQDAAFWADIENKTKLVEKDLVAIEAALPKLSPQWASYVANSVLKKVENNQKEKWLGLLLALDTKTCGIEDGIIFSLRNTSISKFTKDFFTTQMRLVQGFESIKFKEEALKQVTARFPNKPKDTELAKLIAEYVIDHPGLASKVPWIANENIGVPKKSVNSILEKLNEYLAKKNCSTAESFYRSEIVKNQNKPTFTEARISASIVDQCYRSRSQERRLAFWRNLETPLKQAYGDQGMFLSQIHQGLLLNFREKFPQARALLQKVAQPENAKINADLYSEAFYRLAQVEIDSGDRDASRLALTNFLNTKPKDLDRITFAYRWLVIIDFSANKLSDVHNWLGKLNESIAVNPSLESDKGFVEFWRGRTYAKQENISKAVATWKDLAGTHFSHFYGAMAHLFLEKATGKSYGIKRVFAPEFNKKWLRESFGTDYSTKIDMITDLLSFGAVEKARCEINELAVDGYREQAAKSLLLHATGDWLAAIVELNNIPMAERHRILPHGFESLIFPRKFSNSIQEFTQRIGLDEDLVYAIIRQESVFDPLAESHAGARGLMQLMPATAKGELNQFSKNYVNNEEMANLRYKLQKSHNLFDPDINLTVGIHHLHNLLKRYENPLFVLSAYNANPKAADKWRREIASEDWLIFAESIPWQETRLYVKLVLRNYFYYKRWYDKKDYTYLNALVGDLADNNKISH